MYKVFGATYANGHIAYTANSIPTELAGYFELSNGYVKEKSSARLNSTTTEGYTATEGLISALKAWAVSADALVSTPEGGATAATVKFDKLPYGYYYVTSSVGSAVSVTSTNPNATIKDKNPEPTVEKTITAVEANRGSVRTSNDQTAGVEGIQNNKAAIAEIGSTVTYKAVVTFPSGYHNVVFHDSMSKGLTLVNTGQDKPAVVLKDSSGNQVTQRDGDVTIKSTPDSGDTLTISFKDDISDIATAEITYKATVTSAALQTDPATNTARVTYGNKQSTTSETRVYNAKLTVTKTDGTNPLTGAKFKLKNNSTNKYYSVSNGTVSWVDSEAEATEVEATQTNGTGAATAVFQGLGSGTYTLIESTVPRGYQKAADTEITVSAANAENSFVSSGDNGNSVNLNQVATVVNNAGGILPNTGGVGTTILYMIGAALIIGAVTMLVRRRRQA